MRRRSSLSGVQWYPVLQWLTVRFNDWEEKQYIVDQGNHSHEAKEVERIPIIVAAKEFVNDRRCDGTKPAESETKSSASRTGLARIHLSRVYIDDAEAHSR